MVFPKVQVPALLVTLLVYVSGLRDIPLPEHITPSVDIAGDLAKGATLFAEGDFGGAAIAYVQVLRADRSQSRAYVGVADVISHSGSNPMSGLPYLWKAVELQPINEATWLKIGLIHDRDAIHGDPDTAVEAFSKVVEITTSKLTASLAAGSTDGESLNA